MITITFAPEETAITTPRAVFIPRLLSSVGNDKTSYKGNQSSQVISFNLSPN